MKKKQPYPCERATKKQLKLGALWWCVHHRIHLESLTQSVSGRVSYIRNFKPSREVETRLRNLAPVLHLENLPARLLKAHLAYQKADQAESKVCKAYDKAQDLLDRTPHHWESREKRKKAVKLLSQLNKKVYQARCKTRNSYFKILRSQEKALAKQHNQEYPYNTWNGESIFEGR